MDQSIKVLQIVATLLLFGCVAGQPAGAQEFGAGKIEFSEVRSVFRKRCVTCHNLEEARGNLDLSSMAAIETGSGSGPVIVPGSPNESLLYTVAAHLEEPVMPPNSPKIPGRELDLIKRWIEGMAAGTADAGSAMSGHSVVQEAESISEHHAAIAADATNLLDEEAGAEGFVAVRPLLRSTSVNSIAIHPSKPMLATAGRGQAVFGDLETGEWTGAVNFADGEVTSLKFSSDGKILLIGGGVAGLSGTVLGIDVETGKRVFQIADELDTILALDMSNNGRLLAVGGAKKLVNIYSIDSGKLIHTLRKHTDWVMSLAFSSDGLLLASGDRFGGVFVWNPENGDLFHGLQGHQGPVAAIAWDNGSETLLTGCEDSKLRVWNMHHGEMTAAWDAAVGPIMCLDHVSNNTTFVGGRNAKAKIWVGPAVQGATLEAEDQVVQVGLSKNGELGVFGDSLGNIKVLEIETGKILHVMTLPASDGEVSQLLARLGNMEREYLANIEVELEKSRVNDVAIADIEVAVAVGEESLDTSYLGGDSAESMFTSVVAAHRAMVVSLEAQQELATKLRAVRSQAEQALAELSAAEREAQELLQTQIRLVENSKQQLAALKDVLASKLDREKLVEQLQSENSLIDNTQELLNAITNQPHLVGSQESKLLETLKQNLRERAESTRQAIEDVN